MLPLWEWKIPYTVGAADYMRIPGEIPPGCVGRHVSTRPGHSVSAQFGRSSRGVSEGDVNDFVQITETAAGRYGGLYAVFDRPG